MEQLLFTGNLDCDECRLHSDLCRASGPGHSGLVKMLLAHDNVIVDCQDRCVDFDKGNDFDIFDNIRYGNTALHNAAEEERLEICQLLISHGANKDILNKEEKSPLQLCSPLFAKSLKS